jgi:peptidyl-prolyl cis-trans isomerase A (cyclophilin A)
MTIEVHPEWSPLGASRFMELVDDNFFDDMLFYRAIEGFLIQFGVAATPEVHNRWDGKRFPDEPKGDFPKGTWKKGMLSYAGGGKNSRSCHLFITLSPAGSDNNYGLGGADHETVFAVVTDGIDVLDRINKEYGDQTLSMQHEMGQKGSQIMAEKFPNLDKIKHCAKVKSRMGTPLPAHVHDEE